MPKLIYGFKNNKLHHIDSVSNGIDCDCLCPNCGDKLIAKQRKIYEHHFAHESKECDISIAQETSLHYMAKEILSDCKTIKLPKINVKDKYAFYTIEQYKNINFSIISKDSLIYHIDTYKETNIIIDNVIVEKYLQNIKPDIIIEFEGRKILIEIAVTHFIDEVKKQKIIELDIPTIEIDLSEYKDNINDITYENLKEILLHDINHKHWIYFKQYNNHVKSI